MTSLKLKSASLAMGCEALIFAAGRVACPDRHWALREPPSARLFETNAVIAFRAYLRGGFRGGSAASLAGLCRDPRLKAEVMEELHTIAERSKLQRFEEVRTLAHYKSAVHGTRTTHELYIILKRDAHAFAPPARVSFPYFLAFYP